MSEVTTETTAPVELEVGYAGKSIPRKEDSRLLKGEGVFVDDVKRHGMGYVHFVRSPYAHARIVSVDVSAAEALEGVYGTLTPDEVSVRKAVADAGLDPPSDVHASADYRRHLAQVLAWRAVNDAITRVGGD